MSGLDLREYFEDATEAVTVLVNAQLRHQWSNVRVTVAEDSQDGHTVSLQPVTQMNVRMPDGSVSQVTLPMLLDCPIHFAGGGGTSRTHMVKKGDEGTATFSSQPIDTWHQQGGVQMQVDGRAHSLSDASFLPGGRSDPRKLANVSTVSDQNRSDDGNHVKDLHPQNGITHQSLNMVLSMVGSSVGHLLTSSGMKSIAPKILLNCG